MSDILTRLEIAKIGSCTCVTKTPEVAAHEPDCVYWVIGTAAEEIHRLEEELTKWRKGLNSISYDTKDAEIQRLSEHVEILKLIDSSESFGVKPFRSQGFLNRDCDMGRVYIDLKVHDAERLYSALAQRSKATGADHE